MCLTPTRIALNIKECGEYMFESVYIFHPSGSKIKADKMAITQMIQCHFVQILILYFQV